MTFDSLPSDLFPGPWDKKTGKCEPIDPTKCKKRLRLGVALIIFAFFSAGLGFYDLSVWNQEPLGYGLAMLIFGSLVFVVGIVISASAFPRLFDTGNKGI